MGVYKKKLRMHTGAWARAHWAPTPSVRLWLAVDCWTVEKVVRKSFATLSCGIFMSFGTCR